MKEQTKAGQADGLKLCFACLILVFVLHFSFIQFLLLSTVCPLGSVPYTNWMVLGTLTLYFPVVISVLWKLGFSSVLWTLSLSPAKMQAVLAHLNPVSLLLVQFWDDGTTPFS